LPRSVFIVDDNSAVRRSLVRLFTSGGFDVCGEAENGEEAIDIARQLNPGLIVMDISMPGISGIDAARSLRQVLPRVQIILLSDYVLLFQDHEARSLGISAIVSKSECSSVLLFQARTLLQTAA
jgi:DNA-binding NarL/FixJ family response regulator